MGRLRAECALLRQTNTAQSADLHALTTEKVRLTAALDESNARLAAVRAEWAAQLRARAAEDAAADARRTDAIAALETENRRLRADLEAALHQHQAPPARSGGRRGGNSGNVQTLGGRDADMPYTFNITTRD